MLFFKILIFILIPFLLNGQQKINTTGNNSPIEIKEKNNQMKEDIAKTDISSDKDIQSFINKFDGKIKLNTIKPLE